jgi:hypothetical protein
LNVIKSITLNQLLKIEGGIAAFPAGPPAWPVADDAIVTSINNALTSGQWGLYEGELLQQVHAALRSMWGLEHSLLCSSGTVAVELALRAAGVKAGDEVILAAYDFPGNFRAIEAVGARPVLVDVLPGRWTIDARHVEAAFPPKRVPSWFRTCTAKRPTCNPSLRSRGNREPELSRMSASRPARCLMGVCWAPSGMSQC